jgi:hypothetical protein
MSVTVIRQPGRRSKKDQAHDAELTQLGSKAAQVRYACEVVSQQPGPLTVQVVRMWLADHGVAEDPGDAKRRTYVSRIVNEWRRERGLTDTDIPTDAPVEPAAQEHASTPTEQHANTATKRAVPRDATASDPEAGRVTKPEPTPKPEVLAPLPATVPAHLSVTPVPDVRASDTVTRADTRAVEPPHVVQGELPAYVSESSPRAGASTPEPHLVQRARRLRLASYLVLSAVAAAGAALSYQSLEAAAEDVFPHRLAQVFPLLVDALIVGASLAFLAGAVVGRGRAGWRLTAHVGVGGTIFLNALAAESLVTVPWHIAAPIVWSALVELTARDLLGDYRAAHARPDSIPFALWLTAPGESTSTWLRVRRQAAHASVRVDVGAHAAAREALRMALPGYRARKVRRVISRQLRAGSVTPGAVVSQAVAIMGEIPTTSAQAVLRDVLSNAVGGVTPAPLPVAKRVHPVCTGWAGGRLVKARQQDITHLRAALRGANSSQRETSPHSATASRAANSHASQNRPSPAPSQALRNPYIEITSAAEQESKTTTQEAMSPVSQKGTKQ